MYINEHRRRWSVSKKSLLSVSVYLISVNKFASQFFWEEELFELSCSKKKIEKSVGISIVFFAIRLCERGMDRAGKTS